MSILSDLIPGLSTIKGYIYLAVGVFIITIAGLAFWHYNTVIHQLDIEKAKNSQLQSEVNTQNETLKKMASNIESWQQSQKQFEAAVQRMQDVSDLANRNLGVLNEIFAKHNLEELSLKKPTAMEIRINRGTSRAFLMLKCASGSTDKDCIVAGSGQDPGIAQPNPDPHLSGTLGSNNQRSPSSGR